MSPSVLWALTAMLNCETIMIDKPKDRETVAERRCSVIQPPSNPFRLKEFPLNGDGRGERDTRSNHRSGD